MSTMKYLGIVGTSHLSEWEEMDARKRIVYEIRKFEYETLDKICIISGGAKGVDTLVERLCEEQRILFTAFLPDTQNWESYKKRNLIIASMSDKVICITTPYKTQKCYHCNKDHQRTGGCYTVKLAKHLNKPTEVIVL